MRVRVEQFYMTFTSNR